MTRKGGQDFDLWKESSQSYGQDHELLGKTLKKRVIEFIFRTCNFTKNDFK